MLHVMGDAAASCGVIVAALIIWRTGWTPADPIASVVISLIIFASSYRLIRDSFRIMMEGVPSCLRLDDVSRAICSVPGVVQVHDLHVWGVCSAHIILSAHAVIDNLRISQAPMIMDEMKKRLKELFGIEHTTIQLEGKSCGQGVVVCPVGRRSFEAATWSRWREPPDLAGIHDHVPGNDKGTVGRVTAFTAWCRTAA